MKKIIFLLAGIIAISTAVAPVTNAQFRNTVPVQKNAAPKEDSLMTKQEVFSGDVFFVKHIMDQPVFKVELNNIAPQGCLLIIRNVYSEEIHREYITKCQNFARNFRFLSSEDNEYTFEVYNRKHQLLLKRFSVNNITEVKCEVTEKE